MSLLKSDGLLFNKMLALSHNMAQTPWIWYRLGLCLSYTSNKNLREMAFSTVLRAYISNAGKMWDFPVCLIFLTLVREVYLPTEA